MSIRGARIVVANPGLEVARPVVEGCLALGAHVIAASPVRTRLEALRAELGQHERLWVADCDVGDAGSVARLLQDVARDGGRPVAVLVSAAGAPVGDIEPFVSGCVRAMLAHGDGRLLVAAVEPSAEAVSWLTRRSTELQAEGMALAALHASGALPGSAWLARLIELADPERPPAVGWVAASDRATAQRGAAGSRDPHARTIVVGDVHGCLAELQELLASCDAGPLDDVVLVGDLVAKGPDSAGVLALVRELGARAVLGNHDAHVLRCRDALERGEPMPRPGSEHERLARELPDEALSQLRSLPPWLELPGHGALVVHAGLVPGVELASQDLDMLLNIRTLTPDGRGSRRPDAGPPWAESYRGPPFVLFGHHAGRGLQRHPHALGLDTGCVYGGRLTACVLPERRLLDVAARRAYSPVGAGAP